MHSQPAYLPSDMPRGNNIYLSLGEYVQISVPGIFRKNNIQYYSLVIAISTAYIGWTQDGNTSTNTELIICKMSGSDSLFTCNITIFIMIIHVRIFQNIIQFHKMVFTVRDSLIGDVCPVEGSKLRLHLTSSNLHINDNSSK